MNKEDNNLNVSGIRDVYKLILNYLLQFRHTSVNDQDANNLLNEIEFRRMDLSAEVYASLIELQSNYLQLLPLYSLWFSATAEDRGQICLTCEKAVESFLEFVSNSPACFSASIAPEKIGGFMLAFQEQFDTSLQYMVKPDMLSWLSPTDRLYQAGADMLFDILTCAEEKEVT